MEPLPLLGIRVLLIIGMACINQGQLGSFRTSLQILYYSNHGHRHAFTLDERSISLFQWSSLDKGYVLKSKVVIVYINVGLDKRIWWTIN